MYQLYSLLLTLGFIVLLPRFLFDTLRHGKYIAGFRERLGSLETLITRCLVGNVSREPSRSRKPAMYLP